MDPENLLGWGESPAPAVPSTEFDEIIIPEMPTSGTAASTVTLTSSNSFWANSTSTTGPIVARSTRAVVSMDELRLLSDLGFKFSVAGGAVTQLSLPETLNADQYDLLRGFMATPPQWMAASVVDDITLHLAIKREPKTKKETMLAKILRLYKASMTGDVRSPLVHIVGPPGCGKSTSVEQAANLLGVNLHIINVSRMSPLDIEGVQMPTADHAKLLLLTATWWTDLEEGDIVLFDEFLRGFPEVYNGLLDILTSRRVGAFHLPKVFFIAASNSVATYDKALEDRLLHLMVEDPRKNKGEKAHMAKLLVEGIGLHPDMAEPKNFAMEQLLESEVLPMFALLDAFKGKATVGGTKSFEGHSVRNLIGQARLRQIESAALKELIEASNRHAESRGQWQFIVLPDGARPHPNYVVQAKKLLGNPRLTEIQAQNLEINLELIELEAALKEEV